MRQAEELARRVRYDQTHPDVPGPRYVSPRDTGPVVETPEPVRNRFWVIMSGIAMIMFGCTFFSLISIPLILFGIGWIFLG
jgi:hypothetical protein